MSDFMLVVEVSLNGTGAMSLFLAFGLMLLTVSHLCDISFRWDDKELALNKVITGVGILLLILAVLSVFSLDSFEIIELWREVSS